jgi:hypothetical protein
MKHITIIITLLIASTAWAEPTKKPRTEDQRVVLRLDDQREDVVKEEKSELLRLFDYRAPQGAEKLITFTPKARGMLSWQ